MKAIEAPMGTGVTTLKRGGCMKTGEFVHEATGQKLREYDEVQRPCPGRVRNSQIDVVVQSATKC